MNPLREVLDQQRVPVANSGAFKGLVDRRLDAKNQDRNRQDESC